MFTMKICGSPRKIIVLVPFYTSIHRSGMKGYYLSLRSHVSFWYSSFDSSLWYERILSFASKSWYLLDTHLQRKNPLRKPRFWRSISKELFQSFRRNLMQLWNSVALLVESNHLEGHFLHSLHISDAYVSISHHNC